MENKYLCAWFLAQEGVRPKNLEELYALFGSANAAFEAGYACLENALSLDEGVLHHVWNNWKRGGAEAYAERLLLHGIRVMMPYDADYPELLSSISDPPLLYAKGLALPADQVHVAVIGSRKATQYGKRVAEHMSRDLAECGVNIVSGLARGIDSAAHRGALLTTRGTTCAVVATGLDTVYPPENVSLAASIAERGTLLSEQPLGTLPLPFYFPARNRIISGMSLGVLVVEAGEKSGTQITVGCALEQGRDVFAVPGSIYAANSHGPHLMIRQGARLVESADDILCELNLMQSALQPEKKEDVQLSLIQEKLLSLLALDPLHIDQLHAASRIPVGTLLSELMQLELLEQVIALPGGMYEAVHQQRT